MPNNTHIKFKSSNWYGFTYYLTGSIVVNGTTVFSCSSTSGSHYVSINSQNTEYPITANSGYSAPPWSSGSITGNTDGTKTVTVKFNFSGYSVSGTGANGLKRHCADDRTAKIHRKHERSNDGIGGNDQYYPRILVVYAHTDLFFRQRKRDDQDKDHSNIRFMDTGFDLGKSGAEQHLRHGHHYLFHL